MNEKLIELALSQFTSSSTHHDGASLGTALSGGTLFEYRDPDTQRWTNYGDSWTHIGRGLITELANRGLITSEADGWYRRS